MTILDFAWDFIWFNVLFAIGGVYTFEVLSKFAPNESKYKIATRYGDLIGATLLVTFLTIASPYFWAYMDGKEILGFKITLGWFNPFVSFIFGTSWNSAFKVIRYYQKKAEKESKK